MDSEDVYKYITPNISLDPNVAFTGSQAQQFNAGLQVGNDAQKAYGIEYQVPYAIRYNLPIVVTDLANNIGVPDIVGNGTGGAFGSNISVGPPGPPGEPGETGTGTPGGTDTTVQINDGGTFNGFTQFTWDKDTNTLAVTGTVDIEGTLLSQSDFFIVTTDPAVDVDSSDITISTGVTTGTGNSGGINIFSGGSDNGGGGVFITADANALVPGNGVQILSNRNIYLFPATIGDGISSNVVIASNTPQVVADGIGGVAIGNAFTNPSTTPTDGGILYVSGGALFFLGSSGTLTPIAPA